MKKLVRKLTGKNKAVEASSRTSTWETEPPRGTELSAPGAFSPPIPSPSNGTSRRPRRPKETVDVNYSDYAPFAPAPSSAASTAAPTPAVHNPASQQQLLRDIELAKQLAAEELGAPSHPPHPSAHTQPLTPQQSEDQAAAAAAVASEAAQQRRQEEEANRQAAYQAELDAVLAESVQQAEYDHILREIKLWRLDLSGALDDVAAAQREAQRRREEIDGQLAEASPDDEEGWKQVMRLSGSHAEVEGKLQDLGRRLAPIRDAVRSLGDLEAYIRADQPPVDEACRSLDRIIVQLLEALNTAGFTFHHPIAPMWGQEGEKAGREGAGKESKPGDPLRELVHSLIEQSRRLPPPPPPAPDAQEGEGQEDTPAAEAAEAEESEPPAPPSPPPEPPSPRETPTVDAEPSPLSPQPSETEGGRCVTPRAVSRGGGGSTPGSSSRRALSGTPGSSGTGGRRRGSGVKPTPEDTIKRLPRVVALNNELQKGVVAEAVGWAHTKPEGGAAPTNPTGFPGASLGRSTPKTFSPAMFPTRLPPSSSRSQTEGEEAEEKVATFQAASLQEACEFVEGVCQQGVPRGGVRGQEGEAMSGVRWPREKWATLSEAAEVSGKLHSMTAELSTWSVDAMAGTVAESHRLASLIDSASRVVGRVSYIHDPLRQRMAKAGVPWDGQLLSELRWAAQHAAAQLMQHALAEAKELSRSKKWQAHAVLQPLGHASMGVFKVHQLCGGLNNQATLLFDELQERTTHYARLIDHQWLRNTKWA